jgi:hypothetical protein
MLSVSCNCCVDFCQKKDQAVVLKDEVLGQAEKKR